MAPPKNQLMPPSLRRARGIVFHYTSADGLLGILGSRTLWASEASSLNDLAEVRRGWDIIEEWLELRKVRSEAADWLWDFARNPIQAKHEVFVLSGTVADDDAAQWRLYGGGAHGYALGIAASARLAPITSAPIAARRATTRSGGSFGLYLGEVVSVTPWFHVLYEQRDVEWALTELVREFDRQLRVLRGSHLPPDEFAENREDLRGQAIEALGAIAHLTKEPGFSGEREVRVVTTYLFANAHIQYRTGPHGVISYGSLARAPRGHAPTRILRPSGSSTTSAYASGKLTLPIRSVRTGPLLAEEHAQTVERLLAQHDLASAAVHRSRVRLR